MTVQLPSIVILGAGGHGKVVLEVCLAARRAVAGFLDPAFAVGECVLGVPVLGGHECLQSAEFVKNHQFVLGVGNLVLRRQLIHLLRQCEAEVVTAIHPNAVVSPSAVVGQGSVIMAGAVVNAEARIGAHVILNTACSVDHDAILGEGCHIAPGARMAGQVRCGDDVFVGIGAAILPMITLGAGAVVAAGAVVIRDVPPGSTVAGVPAQVLFAK